MHMNNIIVNPEDNKELALKIWRTVKNFHHDYPMKRDYCDSINTDLKQELAYDGIKARRVYGGSQKVGHN